LEGLAWLDPTNMLKSVALPPVVVESVASNEDDFSASAGSVRLGPKQDSFRIAYTIPVLTHPERVHFYYRLAGFSDWTDVGTRREAVFTNVPPGHFHFEVRAFSDDGAVSVTSTPLTLVRLPAWYQTWWFRTLALLSLFLLVWLAFAYRLRNERRLVANRVAARHAERERIARELHDTLLQGFQGLLMRVQVWVGDRDLSAARRSEMDHAIDQTQDLLSQGRDRILALRASNEEPRKLSTELREFCARFATTHPVRIQVIDAMPDVTLPNTLANEVLAIAHEAISNAVIHAKASLIEVELKRTEEAVQLTVRDDGCGIAAGIAGDGGREGHWGLIGMRERAQRMGAEFSISSDLVKGTHVSLTVPDVSRSPQRMRIWQRGASH
jgi:signal transduction histidine kinase